MISTKVADLLLCVLKYMEKLSLLPYHPVKMQSCYEQLEQLQPQLKELQQRFEFSSPAVFVQRGQILLREVCFGEVNKNLFI